MIEKADWDAACQELMRERQPSDPAPLTQEEEDEDWAKLQAKLPALKQPLPRAKAPSVEAPPARPAAVLTIRPSRSSYQRLKVAARAAALVAIVLGGLSLWMWSEVRRLSRELGSPRVPGHYVLLPDGVRGARQPAIALPGAPDSFLLAPSLLDLPAFPSYRLDIFQMTGGKPRRVWSASGLDRRADDTVEIWVPRTFLKPGPYQLRIYGGGADRGKSLATYTVELPD